MAKKEIKNLGGRPPTEPYTKKIMRFSKIENSYRELLKNIDDENERMVIERFYDELKKRVI